MPFKNTGEQEIEQFDTNPLSPSFGTRRWIVSGVNTTACPVPPPASSQFRSSLIVETVYRDDCGGNDVPNGVVYRLETGFRTSVISQQNADDQARAYFDSHKQAFANANDTCQPVAALYTCEIDVNGCWTGYVVITATGAREQYSTQQQYDHCFVPQAQGPNGPQLQPCPAI